MRLTLLIVFLLDFFGLYASSIVHRGLQREEISQEIRIENYMSFGFGLELEHRVLSDSINPEDSLSKEAVSMPPTKIAEYKGGMNKLYAFIGKKVKYPFRCMDAGIEGVAIIEFVVNTDGTLDKVKAVSKLRNCPEMEEEAIRVILMTSGKWIPAKMGDKFVRSTYRLPVRFDMGE